MVAVMISFCGGEGIKIYDLDVLSWICLLKGFSMWHSGKESAWQCRKYKRCAFNPWVRNIPWRRKWQPIPVLLLGKSHGQKSLVGYSPWGHRVGHRSAQHTHARTHAHMHARTRASSGCNVWTARRRLAIWL